jgi:ABC-2 type transport system ATP-binding protein
MQSQGPILVVEKLRKDFGRIQALKGIELVLDRPGVFGFLGPNGAGKTTTFKLAGALLRPTAGRVLINGADVQKDTEAARTGLGVLFDSPSFYPHLSGEQNMQVFARWLGKGLDGEIDRLLAMVGLEEAGNRRVKGYSWGMKQRLGLAAALLSDPCLILLDEPTNGLDPAGIAAIRKLLPKLAYDEGRTIFLSSHRMEEVEQICDHITIIHQGNIVAAGSPADLAAGDASIEIHCADPDAALRLLNNIDGVRVAQRTGGRKLQLSAPALGPGRINQMLVEGGIEVEQVLERRESLEDVFFRLTGSKSDEE